jgi:hypothetical protein
MVGKLGIPDELAAKERKEHKDMKKESSRAREGVAADHRLTAAATKFPFCVLCVLLRPIHGR